MSHLLCYIQLLVFLIGRNVVLAKASDNAGESGKDKCCIAKEQLTAATNEINNKLEKQTIEINAKLDKQSEELTGKLEKQSTDVNAKLDKLSEDLNGKLDKQAKEMNAKLDKQTEDLNGELEKQSTDINAKLDKLSEDLIGKLDKQATEINAKLDKQSEDLNGKLDKQASEINAKIDKQSEDLNGKLDNQATEMNAKLDKQSEDLNGKLDNQATEMIAKLDRQTADLNAKLDEQARDLETLKVRLNKTAASTKDISTQLERHSADLLSHDERLKEHDASQKNDCRVAQSEVTELAQKVDDAVAEPRDCSDIYALGHTTSGIYRVYPGNSAKRIQADVYCDMTSSIWLVFQRRQDGSVNFERSWSDYAAGFGNLNGEFWLGNEILYMLTSNRNYKLRILIEGFDRDRRYADYANFSISSSADRYRLTVNGYSGDAGDSFSYHTGMQFSTKDADNDLYKEGNRAQLYRGAWWYHSSYHSNLNGLYGPHRSNAHGIEWGTYRGYQYSHKKTEMKISAWD